MPVGQHRARWGPHVAPVWFVWAYGAMWILSPNRSQRWVNLERNPRAGAVVDAGTASDTLRGVQLSGQVEIVGEVPRSGGPGVAELDDVEPLYAAKYADGGSIYDGKHAWLRLVPHTIVSWDFRKLGV